MKINHISNKQGGGKTAEVLIYEDIGESFWMSGISAKRFAQELKSAEPFDDLHIRINSYGGVVTDGIAMFNTLRDYAARGITISATVDGIAASIASIILLAADVRKMASNAWLMIHNPSSMVFGDASAMRREADLLDSIRESSLLAIYSDRTSLDRDKAAELLDAETWFNGDDAFSDGFVHEVLTPSRAVAWQSDKLARFRNAPAHEETSQQGQSSPHIDTRIRQHGMSHYIMTRGLK